MPSASGKCQQDILDALLGAIVVRVTFFLEDVNDGFWAIAVDRDVVLGDVGIVDPVAFDSIALCPTPPLLLVLLDPIGEHRRLLARLSPGGWFGGLSTGRSAHGDLHQATFDRAIVEDVSPRGPKTEVFEVASVGGEHISGPSVEGALEGIS